MARPDRPRILFGVGSLSVGGSENQLLELLRSLHPEHVEAVLVLQHVGEPRRRIDEIRALGVRTYVIGPVDGSRALRPFRTAVRYERVVRGVRPDAVYAWLEESSLFLAPVSRLHGVGVAVARRNISGAIVERRRIAAIAIRAAERLAHVVTANSPAVLDRALERGIRADRLRLVVNGHTIVEPPPVPPSPPVTIGYLARFRREKGHLRLIDALSRMRTATPWRVVLGGEGALRPAIEAAIAAAGLEERVTLAGEIADSRAFWGQTHVCALLSDHEGSPNALIEGALAGRPLLATAVGGSVEVVGRDAGLLVAPTDVGGIAAALDRLVEDPQLRSRFGAAARRRAAERFTIEQSAAGHLAALGDALRYGR